MHKRLYDFIKKNKILHENQFGFQEGKSTEHAILDLHKYNSVNRKTGKIQLHILRFSKSF